MGKAVYTREQRQNAVRLLIEGKHTHKEISATTGVGLSRVQSLSRQFVGRGVNDRIMESKLRRPKPEDFIDATIGINTHKQTISGEIKRTLPNLSNLNKNQLIRILCSMKWKGDNDEKE